MAFQSVKPVQQSKLRYDSTIATISGGGAGNRSAALPRMASASNGLGSQLPSTHKLSTQASVSPFHAAKGSAFSTVFKNETAAFVVSNNDTFPQFGRAVDRGMNTRLASQVGYDLKI